MAGEIQNLCNLNFSNIKPEYKTIAKDFAKAEVKSIFSEKLNPKQNKK